MKFWYPGVQCDKHRCDMRHDCEDGLAICDECMAEAAPMGCAVAVIVVLAAVFVAAM